MRLRRWRQASRGRALLAILLTFGAAGRGLAGAAPTEGEYVALVTEIRGDWLVETPPGFQKSLSLGTGIPPGSRISPATKQPEAKIIVAYLYEHNPTICTC